MTVMSFPESFDIEKKIYICKMQTTIKEDDYLENG